MSLQTHIEELNRRHRAIEKEIESAKSARSAAPLHLTELKRKKLQLKDEIAKLALGAHRPAHGSAASEACDPRCRSHRPRAFRGQH